MPYVVLYERQCEIPIWVSYFLHHEKLMGVYIGIPYDSNMGVLSTPDAKPTYISYGCYRWIFFTKFLQQ